jgi:hypothetical protein
MTMPMGPEMIFEDQGAAPVASMGLADVPGPEAQRPAPASPYPDPVISLNDAQRDKLTKWLDQWLADLKSAHSLKLSEWAEQERAYRARSEGPQSIPYIGACGDVVPVIAMAVDPIHARLDTGIFKGDPVIRFKALKKRAVKYVASLEVFVEFYQKHKLHLRQVASPRLLECAKHGTMAFKTVYESDKYKIKTYDKEWKVIDKEVTRFKGPKVYGISLADLLFPPNYQSVQDCPIVAERQRFFETDLRIAEKAGKIKDVDKLQGQEKTERDELEQERQQSANHTENSSMQTNMHEVFECWFDYDIDGDGLPERMVATYHESTRTFLQLRYNWYFHQRKPYTIIPYSISNDSLYGIGIGEMSLFFQEAQTKWHRMATDNTYLANIRMFIARKESGIEEVPKLYTGRVFFVDNPREDFIPFQAAEVYQSTLAERQNLFGLAEKRTGVSDYLTGRESPIVGSRATATSTVALIQEGTRRVEEVLENIRVGFAEIIENCIYIWMQYGLDGLDDLVFGDDQIAEDLKDFFNSVDEDNVGGSLAVDLSATDAANNRAIQQQVQLAIIQTMMQYLNKLVEAGQLAISAAQTQPQLTGLIGEVMEAARKLFKDLLAKYDIRNPDDYLPDLEKFLSAATGQGGGGVANGRDPNVQGDPSIPSVSREVFSPPDATGEGMLQGGLPPGVQIPGASGGLS